MLSHLVLTICQIVIAFIMLGALIVFIFTIRDAWLSLLDWFAACSRRRHQYKLDRRQSRQFKEFHDGPKSS